MDPTHLLIANILNSIRTHRRPRRSDQCGPAKRIDGLTSVSNNDNAIRDRFEESELPPNPPSSSILSNNVALSCRVDSKPAPSAVPSGVEIPVAPRSSLESMVVPTNLVFPQAFPWPPRSPPPPSRHPLGHLVSKLDAFEAWINPGRGFAIATNPILSQAFASFGGLAAGSFVFWVSQTRRTCSARLPGGPTHQEFSSRTRSILPLLLSASFTH